MKRFKRVFLFLLLALLIFTGILLYFTWTFESRQIEADPVAKIEIGEAPVKHFAESLQYPTVSTENGIEFDILAFESFWKFMDSTYALADTVLEKQTFNRYSRLYHWPGQQKDLKPIVFVAHLDVVPVIESNLPEWKQEPFSGAIVGDTVWGRGAIDDKNVVIALMEATEWLLRKDFQPARGMYFALVHDEEIGGRDGALVVAKHLEQQGVEAEFILDEGGYLTQGLIPDIDPPVALIGLAEKGFLSLELSVDIEGGHSSIPGPETAIDVLSTAVAKLKTNPFPAKITPVIDGFIDYVGPEMPFAKKLIFANSGLFGSLIIGVYEEKASGNALVRTTTAPTLFHAGVKDNVVPKVAKATINFRILPGETVETVIERVREVIDDERIELTPGEFKSDPSDISSTESFGFQLLHQTIAEIYPEALVSPYLMVGATDSRHFRGVSPDAYRFSPILITSSNIKSFHGINERLAVSEFEQSVRFYVQLIQNASAMK